MLVTENQLDQWVRAHAREAQGLVVELVWRLVAASVPQPRERRFPLGDSIGQHGPDGRLDADVGFEPFVPDGRSLWEIGTSLDAGAKATRDYNGLMEAAVPEAERLETTFVFITPLSGTRGWEDTWKPEAQAKWLDERRNRREWKDVRVIDGTRLIDWVGQFPAVALWLLQRIAGIPPAQVETPDQRWEVIRSIGEPPPLVTQLFLANRQEARDKIAAVFAGDTQQAKLDTLYPDQIVDFVCAHVADLGLEHRAEVAGRCVIVSGLDAWVSLVSVRQRQVLVADAALDLSGDSGTKLIQRARRAGHAVIFGGPPGGVPDPTSAPLRQPSVHHVEEALRSAGYAEQRAKSLAQRSGGNLGSLLRCVQNLSILPAWAEDSAAAELAIAAMLGAWTDASEADRAAVERLVGNSYGEWIGRLRDAARRPDTPLIHQEGRWRFVPRFEGWYALGPSLFDEHLDRLREVALAVLGERDPQFDLDKNVRYAAPIYGKVRVHSHPMREGLADTLALLGSHPRALTSCSLGKAEATATLTVRALLANADWTRWAGLDNVLPLLAEAAPDEFLDCLDRMLHAAPEVVDALFAQEGDAFGGRSYVTGLLWALETLAWSPAYLGRVVSSLGEMAARDPGGRWANRPANSLREILLPWYPQTCAPVAQRRAAVAALLHEQPVVGWKLVLALLPELQGVATPTRRPAWRPFIPDDWTPGVTRAEDWAQVAIYARLAVDAAKRDEARLAELIDRWASLPPDAREDLYAHLGSESIANLPAESRQRVWSALVELVTQHRMFADAEWAMEPAWIDRLGVLAKRLTPSAASVRHRLLFSERGITLSEEQGNHDEQARRLERRRQAAVAEVAADGGVPAVVAFAQVVDTPWRVGVALGQVGILGPASGATTIMAADDEKLLGGDQPDDARAADAPLDGDAAVDTAVLPALLAAEPKAVAQFAGGFVWGRFQRYGWPWVDALDMAAWTPAELGQFFAFLPFLPDTWDRAERRLGGDTADYWTRVTANPYETKAGLERAVEALLRHGRPHAAVNCLARMVHDGQALEPALIVRALLALVPASKGIGVNPSYEALELIKALQADPRTTHDELFRVEWAYLPLLCAHQGGTPNFLAERLATHPEFFCQLIRLCFRPRRATVAAREGAEAPRTSSRVEPTDGTSAPPEAAANSVVDNAGDAPDADGREPNTSASELVSATAENAYRLLHNWRVPPGMRSDGEFDGAALSAWMEAMRLEAASTGHLEIAMTMSGHVLTHVPPDPGGLWIHRAAATLLNARDADDLRNGFRTQILNARGVYCVDPTGTPEDELARTYRKRADELELAGYSRLATTVREIAVSYTREAERVRAESGAEA